MVNKALKVHGRRHCRRLGLLTRETHGFWREAILGESGAGSNHGFVMCLCRSFEPEVVAKGLKCHFYCIKSFELICAEKKAREPKSSCTWW